MPHASDLVARLRAIDEKARAEMAGPLAELEAIPDPVPSSPTFVVGQTEPGKGLVGVQGPRTKIEKGTSGVAKINTTSPVYDTRFECWVDPVGAVNRFVNCEFVGPPMSGSSARSPLVKNTASTIVESRFDFCTFHQENPTVSGITPIMGFNYSLHRCDSYHLGNGPEMYAAPNGAVNVRVEGCWVHDLVWFAQDLHPDGTHTDALQVHNGGRDVVIVGNRFDAYHATDAGEKGGVAMSAAMLSPAPETGGVMELVYAANWVNGGQVGMNWGRWTTPTGKRLIVGNRWGSDVSIPVLAKSTLALTIAGNTRAGEPFDIRKNG